VTGVPFLLVQLSDPHVGADWGYGDPGEALAAAVESVGRILPPPDAVLVTGDLTEHGAETEYEELDRLLAPLGAPLHVLAGNHDDRAALRRRFGLPGAGEDPVQYAADLGPLRLIVLDTTCPGEDPGTLDRQRLDWLDAELAAAPEAPTLLAMHHPPVWTGVPPLDAMGLAPADRGALAEVVERHPQVRRLVAGHMHRTIVGDLGGRSVLGAPSTYAQALLDFRSAELRLTGEPPGFAVHALRDGELVSHVQPVV